MSKSKLNKFPIIEPVIKLVPTIKPIGNLTVSSIKKFTLVLFELFCKPITNNANNQELKVEIKKNFAWCTDSRNKKYNSLISKPYGCEYEDLFRKDNLYDIFIILDFNYNSPIKYKGSAIFLHCSESKTKFTEGCIAMSKKDLLKLIPHITSSSNLIIN